MNDAARFLKPAPCAPANLSRRLLNRRVGDDHRRALFAIAVIQQVGKRPLVIFAASKLRILVKDQESARFCVRHCFLSRSRVVLVIAKLAPNGPHQVMSSEVTRVFDLARPIGRNLRLAWASITAENEHTIPARGSLLKLLSLGKAWTIHAAKRIDVPLWKASLG